MNRKTVIERLNNREPLLILAPLAEITHPGFRMLIDQFGGCDLYFTEMISAAAHLKGGPLEPWYTDTKPGADRLIFQVVGSDSANIINAAKSLAKLNPVGIDINMGCSAPEIIKKGGGCAWMRVPDQAVRMVETARKQLPEEISLSVKLRLGEEEDPEKLINFCRNLESAGVDFLTLHPKTRKEKHSRPPRWEHIKTLCDSLTVPVIGNGHVTSSEIAIRQFRKTGCNGIMIGRQAVKEPWIFKRIRSDMSVNYDSFTVDLLEVVQDFTGLLRINQPEEFQRTRAIRFSAWFYTNLFWGHHFQTSEVSRTQNPEQITELYRMYFDKHPEERFRNIISAFDQNNPADYHDS